MADGPIPPPEPDAGTPNLDRALIEEATRKAGLVWVTCPPPNQVGAMSRRDRPAAEQGGEPVQGAARPAWHIWLDGAAYVVVGGGEQPLRDLVDCLRATVTVPSKDTGARVVTWSATVTVVDPSSPLWTPVTTALAAKRLNAEGGAAMVQRWARESAVVRLEPTGEVLDTAADPLTRSLAAPPRPTSATTRGRQPRMVGGVPRRRR